MAYWKETCSCCQSKIMSVVESLRLDVWVRVSNCASLLVNFYNIFLIATVSPPSMKHYKYFMLHLTVSECSQKCSKMYDTLFSATLLAYQPEVVLPVLGFVIRGPMGAFNIPYIGYIFVCQQLNDILSSSCSAYSLAAK